MSRITEWAYRPFSKRQSKRAGCPFYQTLVLFLVLLTTPAFAQDDNVVTNLADLAQPAFGGSHSFYLAFTPWQWQACSLDEPRWVDFSQLACADLLQACTNLRASPQVYGMQLVVVQLTKNVLTGETLVQSECSTDVVMRIAALSDYQPGARWADRGVW